MSSTSPLNLPGLVQGKSQVEVWGTTSLSLYPKGGREVFFTHFLPHVTLEGEMILFYHFFFIHDNTPALYLIPSWNSRRLCSKIHRCTVCYPIECLLGWRMVFDKSSTFYYIDKKDSSYAMNRYPFDYF